MPFIAGTPAPVALDGALATAIGSKIYVFGGEGSSPRVAARVYDTIADTWTSLTAAPSDLDWLSSACAIGTKIYILGWDFDRFLVYDTVADSWTNKTSGMPSHFGSTGQFTGCTDGVKLYAIQSIDSSHRGRLVSYDPGTDTWDTSSYPQIPSGVAPNGIASGAIFKIGDDVIYCNGWQSSPDGIVARIDVTAGTPTWTAGSTNSVHLEDFPPTIDGSPLAILIGGDGASVSDSTGVRIYDPTSDAWSDGPTLTVSRTAACAAIADDVLYVIGGQSAGSATATVEKAPMSDFTGPTAVTGTGPRTRGQVSFLGTRTQIEARVDTGWEFNARTRDASATISVDDGVAPPPDPHHLINTQWFVITGPPDFDANHQPIADSWPATRHTGVWGRYRLVVAGRDVTYFRGAQTLVLNESDTEPFGDDVLTVQFPMIGPFEQLGVGELAWLPGTDDDRHVRVVVEKVTAGGARSLRWEGDCNVISDSSAGQTAPLVVSFLGLVKTLDQRITKPRTTSDPIDKGRLIHRFIANEVRYGWNGHGPALVEIGDDTAERGGYGDPLMTVTIQNLLASMQTDEQTQWTLTNKRPRGMKLIIKDRTTVHFTLWCGQPGVTHALTRNLEHAARAIFGEGMDHGTQHWRNTQFPNAQLNPPAYPYDPTPALVCGVNLFCPGGSLTGFQEFADELRTRGYAMTSHDTYRAADEDVVRDFQGDTGATVDGKVGPQTWSRAFTVGLDAHLLDSYIRPLVVVSAAEPFLYNSRGGIIGPNPGYTGRTRRERLEQFGTLSKADAKRSAKRELPIVQSADFLGTVTAENVDPPEMCSLDTRSGMNLLFKGHRGTDRLLHVAKADKNPGMVPGQNRSVTWTASERADDYVTLAARLQQRRDVVDQSGRTRAPRRGAKISPDFAPWESESGAGFLSRRAQTAGLWNVYPIPAGERGSIVHVRLVASVACLIAAAVFNRQISPATLTRLPGLADPSAGAAGGLDPWQVNAAFLTQTLTYADQPLMAWATGGPGAMQGYWPNTPDVGATVTGVLDDAAGFPFHSAHGQWLWLAVWTSESCLISGDPAFGHRALFPGADA